MICVRNASQGGVKLVVLHYYSASGRPAGLSLWRSIGPETTLRIPSRLPPGEPVLTTLDFIDSSGVPWRRDTSGQLSAPSRRRRQQARDVLEKYFGVAETGPSDNANKAPVSKGLKGRGA